MTTTNVESSLQDVVIAAARRRGWLCVHHRPARTEKGWRTAVQGDGKGFPDLVLVRHERIIFAELKSQRGAVSKDQRRWLDTLADTCVEVYVWRPKDLPVILAVLDRDDAP